MAAGHAGCHRVGQDPCSVGPGTPGEPGDHKNLGEGLYELRVDYGPGDRVYYTMEGNRLILLLVGGDKESQRRDIAKAAGYLQDHRRRHEDGSHD